MSTEPPPRVRVTGPPRRRTVPRRLVDAESPLGEIYLSSLLAEQGRLALRVLLVLALGVASLPAVFFFAPDLADLRPFGIPLAWLLLGVAVHPFLWVLGTWYVRSAERNERDFVDLVTAVSPTEPEKP
ncbi:hypothetical protein [Nocardioides limicola]|uniref:hypothetical protein n=1 Tax=Nocardioides limicola TaxID=2803368 RepID=UPI00193B1011|nr:hypothetical protein [Nocardioides sp. DJM-14]